MKAAGYEKGFEFTCIATSNKALARPSWKR